jgi:hypothetical protein
LDLQVAPVSFFADRPLDLLIRREAVGEQARQLVPIVYRELACGVEDLVPRKHHLSSSLARWT